MAPHLIRMDGETQGKAYPIDRAQLVIGRADNADIVLESKFASRTHAELHYADGIYTLYIPDGKQVAVNGAPASGQVRLTPGDIIDFPEERFTFGEIKRDFGGGTTKPAAAKIDPIRIGIVALIVGFGGYFTWAFFNAPQYYDPPMSAGFEVEDLKVLTQEHPELKNISRDIFYRGDYSSALERLDKEVGSAVSQEERQQVRNVIFGLVRRDVVNQYANGMDHFTTQQLEAARTNFNTVVRLEDVFKRHADGKDAPLKEKLPPHPRMPGVSITLEQAVAEARDYIRRCDAMLEGRKDPGPNAKAESGG
ncbi:MAG: hypothetical protein GEEBNDBF_00241 [bacterium]|nr:hypothetical protein [bacterium]